MTPRGRLALAVLALSACGGNGSERGVAYRPAQEAKCQWRVRCGDPSPFACSVQCDAPIVRSDVVHAMKECFESLGCDESDDVCEKEVAYETVGGDIEGMYEDCVARYRESCPGYTDIDEGLCLAYPLLVQSARREFDACFAADGCAEGCLDEVASICEETF